MSKLCPDCTQVAGLGRYCQYCAFDIQENKPPISKTLDISVASDQNTKVVEVDVKPAPTTNAVQVQPEPAAS